MIVQNILLSGEAYTHEGWGYKNVNVGFSRLYYILDGEAYYEENGTKIRLKQHHLYLTPVKKCFSLSECPTDKLNHTFTHITTLPAVHRLIEIEVRENTPLYDVVALWRKYCLSKNDTLLASIISLLLSCIEQPPTQNTLVRRVQDYIDGMEHFTFDMGHLSHSIGYSREHITRVFEATHHTTPRRYFHMRRMNVALARLLAGERVGEVGEAVGFSTAYAFSKAFKAHFGMSPEVYLQALHRDRPNRT